MNKLNRMLLVALCALFPLLTHADQGSIANTGQAANPAGTLTVSANCADLYFRGWNHGH